MKLLSFLIRVLRDGEAFSLGGEAPVPEERGEFRIVRDLPEGHLESVTASLPLGIKDDEKIFMNGYQSWTYCPEYSRRSSIRPYGLLPRFLVRHFRLDRYGDYHFVDYDRTPGRTHGFSYCYFRHGDRYRLFASLDERPGYTIFRYDANSEVLSVERDCAGLACGGEYHAFDLFYAEGSEDEVFDAWFAAMGARPRTAQKIAGYSSWYNRYRKISRESIIQDLSGCESMLQPGDLFQIDDGWEPYVGDWLEADAAKFPAGMKKMADAIHEKGFKPACGSHPLPRKGAPRFWPNILTGVCSTTAESGAAAASGAAFTRWISTIRGSSLIWRKFLTAFLTNGASIWSNWTSSTLRRLSGRSMRPVEDA